MWLIQKSPHQMDSLYQPCQLSTWHKVTATTGFKASSNTSQGRCLLKKKKKKSPLKGWMVKNKCKTIHPKYRKEKGQLWHHHTNTYRPIVRRSWHDTRSNIRDFTIDMEESKIPFLMPNPRFTNSDFLLDSALELNQFDESRHFNFYFYKIQILKRYSKVVDSVWINYYVLFDNNQMCGNRKA